MHDAGYVSTPIEQSPLSVHAKLPGYAPSPLIELPVIARELGLERLWIKDESSRMGLPAFKILGASYAVIQTVENRIGIDSVSWASIDHLAALAASLRPLTLACATDGNHGRAVARMARLLGFEAIVLVPNDMVPARIEAIRSEGAEVGRRPVPRHLRYGVARI
jgi:diaminopropionate ammonia-lyase